MTYDHERDTAIAEALNQVAVPDHSPGFWAELDDRLAAEAPVLPVRRLGRSIRHGRFPRLLAVAAAAAVLVAAAAVLLSDDEKPQGVRTIDDPTTTTTPDPTAPDPTTTTTAPDPATTTTTTAPRPGTTSARTGGATADAAVIQWIEALAEGDVDKAAGLTGPLTEAYIKSQGGSLRGFLTEAQEGWGGWGDSPDRSTTEVDVRAGDGVERTVVVVMGTNNSEGEDGYRTDALPVAKVGRNGTWLVEPWAFDPERGGRIEMISPSSGESGLNGLAADSAIEASAPGQGDFFFSLDDQPPVKVDGTGRGSAVRGRWDPPGDMKSQSHLLVVGYVDDSIFSAFAGVFAVEG